MRLSVAITALLGTALLGSLLPAPALAQDGGDANVDEVPWFAEGLETEAAAAPVPQWTKPPAVRPAVRTGDRARKDAAIVIGNEAYGALPQATHARADADAWEDWLVHTVGVRSSRITRLTDAGGAEMWTQTRKLASRVRRGGTLWVVFAGHGAVTAPEGGKRTLLGVDADRSTLAVNGLNLEEALRLLGRTNRPERIVFLLDASFAGHSRDGLPLVPGMALEVPPTEPIADDPRVVVWTAARSGGAVDAFGAAGHGAFTWAALGALRGWADGERDGRPDGQVTLAEADAYTARVQRQLGLHAAPGVFADDKHSNGVLADGPWLEAGPDDATLDQLSAERRERRWQDAVAVIRAEAAAFWQHTLETARQGGPEGRAALEGFIAAFADREITISWALALPEVREARQLLARYDDRAGPDGGGQEAVAQVLQAAQKVEEARCDDLFGLEPAAMTGALSDDQVACLQMRVRTERLQTTKEKASLVLIANHEAARDMDAWARAVETHLDQISRADPRLVMQYAVYLFRADAVGRGEDAIHWAEVALENKQRWVGDEYVRNVGALFRLRAETAYKLWQAADQAYRRSRTEDDEWVADQYRGLAKDTAREWLDYQRAADRPHELALQLCTSAAGTPEFCRD